jgi:hypothetical protein
MPGGNLEVWVNENGDIRIRGPVEEIGQMHLAPQWIESRS